MALRSEKDSQFTRWGRANDLQDSTMSELINEDISSINIARLLSNDDIDELKIPLRLVNVL